MLNGDETFALIAGSALVCLLAAASYLALTSCADLPIALRRATASEDGAPRHLLLVIAHPDDEAMFFVPALRAFKQAGWVLQLLCLSNGSGGGNGAVRAQELRDSARFLGFSSEHVRIVDSPDMPDGMKNAWPAAVVARAVADVVREWQPTLLLTFDGRGISGHINHISVHNGVTALVRGGEVDVPCYELETVALARKFTSILDIWLSWINTPHPSNTFALPNVALITCPTAAPSHGAMKAHASQYVWFRKLFVFFSRYAWINTLRRMR